MLVGLIPEVPGEHLSSCTGLSVRLSVVETDGKAVPNFLSIPKLSQLPKYSQKPQCGPSVIRFQRTYSERRRPVCITTVAFPAVFRGTHSPPGPGLTRDNNEPLQFMDVTRQDTQLNDTFLFFPGAWEHTHPIVSALVPSFLP